MGLRDDKRFVLPNSPEKRVLDGSDSQEKRKSAQTGCVRRGPRRGVSDWIQ